MSSSGEPRRSWPGEVAGGRGHPRPAVLPVSGPDPDDVPETIRAAPALHLVSDVCDVVELALEVATSGPALAA